VCAPNLKGRDFAVGDLHGMAALLWAALDRVRFDPTCDRLFSVGDLVDRGPDPLGCLRLLREPWFHAVLGNHERFLLAHLGYPETWRSRFHAWRYTRAWADGLAPTDREELIADLGPRVARLPLALKVLTRSGGAHFLLHAHRPLQGDRVWTDAQLEAALAHPVTAVAPRVRETLTWARTLLRQADRAEGTATPSPPVPGVSPTYVGHTVVHRPRHWAGHTFLDRGVCYATDPSLPLELHALPT
jgi:serine/threonine protein phosphatase 1